MTEPQIEFLTRAGCHLCDSALWVVRRMVARCGGKITIVDIDHNPDLKRRYSDHVPVVLINGAEFARHQVDEQALAERLSSAGMTQPGRLPGSEPST